MKRPSPWLIGALGVMLAVWCGAWFLRNYERVPVEIPAASSEEALRNPLLAAERLLGRFGVTVRSLGVLQDLPPARGTLVLISERLTMNQTQAERIRSWVAAGGHLVVVAWTLADDGERDPLLDPLGVRQELSDRIDLTTPAVAVARVPGADTTMDVKFRPQYRFVAAPTGTVWQIEDRHGLHLLTLRSGQGFVTALTDSDFMTNDRIGQADHAALLWYLTHLAGGGEVWLVYAEDFPSLAALLARHARPVLVSMALLLAATLWWVLPRHGPLLQPPPARARRLSEHIGATGRFLWRNGHAQFLLDGMREDLLRTLRFRHPGWTGAADLQERLARASGLAPERVRLGLIDPADPDQDGFTRQVQCLDLLRKGV